MSDMMDSHANLPVQHTPNPFEEVGREIPRRVIGRLLKFSKGDFLAGQENMELPMGTRFIVNMDMTLRGWIRWENNKPAEQVMGLVAEGFVLPKRDTLGWGYQRGTKEEDADTTDWIRDESTGVMRDPWQETFYLIMRELGPDGVTPLEGEEGLYTFTTSSKGGLDACKELCSVYGKWLRFHPDEFPVVKIGWDSYMHSVAQYGKIKTPEFVTGFITPEQARLGKKVTLFDPRDKGNWMEKKLFGEAVEGQPLVEDVPF
jgi:hypothetical protein